MDKKIIVMGAGAAILFALSSTQKKSDVVVIPPPDNAPILGDGLSVAGIDLPLDYETSNRENWHYKYKQLYQSTTPQNAANQIWALWEDSRNTNFSKFDTKNALIFDLATFGINSIGTLPVVVDADSIPIFDTWANWWDGVTVWDCNVWRVWFDMNKQKYGDNAAKIKFANAWNSSSNWGGYGNFGMGNKCGIDCDFINYFRLKGIDVAIFGATSTCSLVSIPSNLLDAASSTAQGISNTAKLASNILPVTIVGAALYIIYKNSKE